VERPGWPIASLFDRLRDQAALLVRVGDVEFLDRALDRFLSATRFDSSDARAFRADQRPRATAAVSSAASSSKKP
jgi:hypothetical protein